MMLTLLCMYGLVYVVWLVYGDKNACACNIFCNKVVAS